MTRYLFNVIEQQHYYVNTFQIPLASYFHPLFNSKKEFSCIPIPFPSQLTLQGLFSPLFSLLFTQALEYKNIFFFFLIDKDAIHYLCKAASNGYLQNAFYHDERRGHFQAHTRSSGDLILIYSYYRTVCINFCNSTGHGSRRRPCARSLLYLFRIWQGLWRKV